MSFDKTFCAGPWFHMRILPSGEYNFCRWGHGSPGGTIQQEHPVTFFQNTMSTVRKDLLDGKSLDFCRDCYTMEQHGKVSGRQKQLLKVGIDSSKFTETALSSSYFDQFKTSNENNGKTNQLPVDWQIDLGNHCNSNCIFCSPHSSSKLAQEFFKIGLINKLPPKAWTEDSALLEKFIENLKNTPNLMYLHFLGGETLITLGFEKILQALVDNNLNKRLTIGFTTNLTVWPEKVIQLLCKFANVNVGLSIETLDQVNDYVRWPSKIDKVKQTLDDWINLSKKFNWFVSIRITPTILTINRIVPLYQFALDNKVGIESCNFFERPEFLKISVLPEKFRKIAIENLESWIDKNNTTAIQLINVRDLTKTDIAVVQDAISYLNYLKSADDESRRLPELIDYLKLLESNRNNSVIDYLPEYEELFRSAGY